MIYVLSCGCEPRFPGIVRTKLGDTLYCPQHGFVTITAIRRPPRERRPSPGPPALGITDEIDE